MKKSKISATPNKVGLMKPRPLNKQKILIIDALEPDSEVVMVKDISSAVEGIRQEMKKTLEWDKTHCAEVKLERLLNKWFEDVIK